ncbi:PrsW family glutamic-type intramembrane protease [Aestuariivirga litoralis]|uniref:PrsW family glutamic-type intramembrane protease n=1 Tax=Aestuariivirga litoralis TaxID=2650924 RepID=UPI0018C81E94|nr:PrsW family glutamic-type intramembrane protease [Aestuariivirga litoralis]MBG1233906.1 PrsW family intramembrane metalloprotease [Aestuariivirga litoralis]
MSMPNDPKGGNQVPPQMPPTPRDFAAPTLSEMVPFKSKKINVWKSGILIPAAATGIASVLGFKLTDYYQSMYVIMSYLLFIMLYACYAYSGVKKSLLIYVFPIVVVWIEFHTPIWSYLAFIFRNVLPGGIVDDEPFLPAFFHYFFAAGLLEELVKAIPALIGLFLAVRALSKTNATGVAAPKSYLDYIKVQSPMEGMLFGLAAGAYFIFDETMGEYVPKFVELVGKSEGEGSGFAFGFWLLFPRVTNGVIGHMGWAAIFGYFIGLAALYPRSMIKLLAMGWVLVALLHGLWDTAGKLGQYANLAAAIPTLLIFVACLLKAKQLNTATNGNFVPSDSIIVGAQPVPASATAGFKMEEVKATAWGGLASLMNVVNTGAAAAQAAAAAQMAPAPAGLAQAPNAVAKPTFALAAGSARFGIIAGQTLDLAQLFPGQGLPAQCLAEVTVNPKDASQLGLKNLSSASWDVTTDSGSSASAPKGRNVKLSPGTKITIGQCVIQVQSV